MGRTGYKPAPTGGKLHRPVCDPSGDTDHYSDPPFETGPPTGSAPIVNRPYPEDVAAQYKMAPYDHSKRSPDRCHLAYSSPPSGPVLSSRNALRRPTTNHFTHSHFHLRKTVSSHCSWKCTAIAFIFLALVLLTALACFLALGMSTWHADNTHACPLMRDDTDLTSSTSRQKNQVSSSNTNLSKSRVFTEVRLGKVHSYKVPSYGHWNVQLRQKNPSLMKFNYTVSQGARIGVFGRRSDIPSHTRYDFMEILGSGERRNRRAEMDLYSVEFIQFLDRGLWYICVYNDGDQVQEVSFIFRLTDESSLSCPYDCHGHGNCVMGSCICNPDYAGDSCAYRMCPILCSGRGQYVGGECLCSPGWKGKECQLREDECEIPDCNSHGDCLEGSCRCFPGYKGHHCEKVDCLDPECAGHGVCLSGACICKKGWKGADCSEADVDALRCLPDCTGHGQYDLEQQKCMCDEQWTGSDCSQEKCDLDCGIHGRCEGGLCICLEGWSGPKCNDKLCDPRCLEHGQCRNGSCLCIEGWNGRHCTFEGCPRNCNNHGECIMEEGDWLCQCDLDWDGVDCSIPMERKCDDGKDNDNDGLTDCADSECCTESICENTPICVTAADPLDILLRKQPPAITASFFERMQFLIEESVQNYARKNAYNGSLFWSRFNRRRTSVVRGQVVVPSGSGLIGVRVSLTSSSHSGYTMTQETGWFDVLVNGGGAVKLEFQREPFISKEITVMVPWNEIVVVDKVIMKMREDHNEEKKPPLCMDHDYDIMKPVVLATWKHGFQGGCPERSSVLAESQVIQESLQIPGTDLHLVYHSSRAAGYLSTIKLQLTPDVIPSTLRLIHLRISIEGILFQRKFEADPGIKFTYAWNRRNIYRQKVYGAATATVHVGYEYNSCPETIWEVQTTQVSGHDMSISDIGGWNLAIHHKYNFHEGILQKGDGSNIYLKNKPKLLLTTMGDGRQRPLQCDSCNGLSKEQRLLAPVALTSGSDGSIYVGDFNLIRRITPDGRVETIVELSPAQVSYSYHLAVGPLDGKLYISDPERHQVLRTIVMDGVVNGKNNTEPVVGNGDKCLPRDRDLCGDERLAKDARLAYPKGIAISANNEMYIADGTNIRVVDKHGIIHTIIGDYYHKSHWKPVPCGKTVSLSQVNLRWPTELAVNPLDGSLHMLDDHMILKLTQDKRLKVIAGRPLQCPSPSPSRDKSDSATDIYLESPQSIAFAPNGDLYVAESDSQMVNRVRIITSDGRITKFAGAESKCSCLEENCVCFDEEQLMAATSKLNTISAISVTPDGNLHICDQGNLRIRSVTASLPKLNELNEYEIYAPETHEVYIFNRHGQHTSTKNIVTGKTIYTFSYNVNTSFGKLSTVTDAAGNKIYILRDYSNQVNTIENTQGGKCRLEMSRMRMLQSFTTPYNFKHVFDYHSSSGLLRSKTDSSGRSYVYNFDDYGRLTEAITPSGETIKLSYNLSIKGASVTVTRNDQSPISLLIKGSDVTTKIGLTEERITSYSDGSLTVIHPDSSSMEIDTLPYPDLADQTSSIGETLPVTSSMKITLSDEVIQRFQWQYYVYTEGKGEDKRIARVGRKLKVNGELIFLTEFDKEQHTETVYDKKHSPLITAHYDGRDHAVQWQPSQNVTPVQVEYDRFGRLISWKRGLLSRIYDFDIQGRLVEIRYSESNGIMYKYDKKTTGTPSEVILPSGSRYLLQYDNAGSLQVVVTPKGHRHEMATQTSLGFYKLLYLGPGVRHPYVLHYNDRGHILGKLYPENKGRVVFDYDISGKIQTIFCGQERTDFVYYDQKALLKNTAKMLPDLDLRVDFRYQGILIKEEKIRYTSRSGFSGAKFRYRYDGQVTTIEVEINGKIVPDMKYRYNGQSGVLEQVQQFLVHRPKINSIFIQDEMRQNSKTVAFDQYGRISVLAVTLWNKEVYSVNLQYDNHSRIKQARTKIGKDGPVILSNYSYTADGFLEEISGQRLWRYIYDVSGNMKSFFEGQTQISVRYDDGDRLIGYNDAQLYSVDNRGFIVQRGEEKFTFNAKGQLTHIFRLNHYEVHYYYDAKERLCARKDHRDNVTQFFYSNPKNPMQVTHVHFPKNKVTYILLYDTSNHLMYMQEDNTKYYIVSDHLGSPQAVFTSEGALLKEVQRSPFGKVIADSNPNFFLTIDFHGGIRDPLTQIVFLNGRAYDPTGPQWLTPNWEDITKMVKRPFSINLYRFRDNDPVNIRVETDNHLTDMSDWLAVLGFDMSHVLPIPNLTHKPENTVSTKQSLPVISGLSCIAEVVAREFSRLSAVPRTEIQGHTSFLHSVNAPIANLPSVLGDGILLSRQQGTSIVHVVSEASPILRDVMTSVFNDTYMINLHFSLHGQDSFFFIQEDHKKMQEDWDQLQRLGTMFNVTMHPVDNNDKFSKNAQVDLKLHSPSVLLNIRYGTTIAEERQNLIRQARKKAIEEAWQQEAEMLRNGLRGTRDWTKAEKEELMATAKVRGYVGRDIYDLQKYPQLADDPSTVMFQKEDVQRTQLRI